MAQLRGARAGHHRADGNAGGQALGQRHHVELDAGPLVAEPLAGTAHAGLHLVGHHQPVARIAQGAHFAQVFVAHLVDTGLALDGLQEHRHHVRVAFGGLLQRLDVVERHADETLDQRAETLLYRGIAGGRQGGDGAVVEGVFVDHDLGPRYALVMAELIKLDTMRYFPGPVIQQNEFEQVDKQINNQAELNIKINDAVGNLNEQLKHNVSVMVHQEQELEQLTQELYEQKTLNYELNRIVEKLSCTLDEQIMLKNQLNDQDLHIEVKQDDEK